MLGGAVINGVIAPILIWAILQVSNDSEAMGIHRNGLMARVFGYAAVAVMGLAAIAMAVSFLLGA